MSGMDMKLNIKDGSLVTEQGNPLGRNRPVFSFGCEYRVEVVLSPALYGVTRLVAMLDTDFDFSGKSEVCALATFSPSDMAFTLNTRTSRFAEVISGHPSTVGYLQIDAIHEDGTATRVLLDRVVLQGIVADSSESYAVASVRGLEISGNGTWVIDGVDTGVTAGGEPGFSPSASVSVDAEGNVVLTVTDASGTTSQVIRAGETVIPDEFVRRIEKVESGVQSITESVSGKADMATTLSGYGITDAYTKSETDAKLTSAMVACGSVGTYAELPTEGNRPGDVYNIISGDDERGILPGTNVVWKDGGGWDALGGFVDTSSFAVKADAATDHNHDGTYAKIVHSHDISAVQQLQESLDGKSNTGHTHLVSGVIGLQAELDAKSDTDHNHDGTYLPLSGGTLNGDLQLGTINGGLVIKANNSISCGYNSFSTSNSSIAFGLFVQVRSHRTVAFGERISTIYGSANCVLFGEGHSLTSSHANQTYVGKYSKENDDSMLVVGIGTGTSDLRNGLEARTNGDLYVAGEFIEGDTKLADKYAAKTHTHEIADVSGLQDALDGKAEASHTHDYLTDAPSDGKSYVRKNGEWVECSFSGGGSSGGGGSTTDSDKDGIGVGGNPASPGLVGDYSAKRYDRYVVTINNGVQLVDQDVSLSSSSCMAAPEGYRLMARNEMSFESNYYLAITDAGRLEVVKLASDGGNTTGYSLSVESAMEVDSSADWTECDGCFAVKSDGRLYYARVSRDSSANFYFDSIIAVDESASWSRISAKQSVFFTDSAGYETSYAMGNGLVGLRNGKLWRVLSSNDQTDITGWTIEEVSDYGDFSHVVECPFLGQGSFMPNGYVPVLSMIARTFTYAYAMDTRDVPLRLQRTAEQPGSFAWAVGNTGYWYEGSMGYEPLFVCLMDGKLYMVKRSWNDATGFNELAFTDISSSVAGKVVRAYCIDKYTDLTGAKITIITGNDR